MIFILMTIIVAVIITVTFFKKSKHVVDNFPGPPTVPIFGNTLIYLKGRDAAFQTFIDCALKYYPMYRTWQGSIPVAHPLDPKDVEVLLSSSQHINKSLDYRFLKPWLGDGLLLSTGSKWHMRRRLLTPGFHFKILEQFLPIFSDNSRTLIKKLKEHVNHVDGFNIVPFVTRCALDIICETAMGTTVNAQEMTDSPYVKSVYSINDIILRRMLRPWLYPNWIFKHTSLGRQHDECVKTLHGFSNKIISERRKQWLNTASRIDKEDFDDLGFGSKKKFAFLDLLLRASQEDASITNEDIREEVDTFMFEGHDTTAMAMSWTLHFLAANPQVQEKCVEELNEIFSDSDRDPTLSDLGNMKYLERVIKETLRLRPSVVFFARALDRTLTIGSHDFPKGTKFNIHIYDIHRNPKIYPEPEKFDPDRFLPENCIGRHPFAYIPFSAGPRNCIGQKFAMMEEKVVLSSLLRRFRMESINFERSNEVCPDIVIRPKYGIDLRLYPRE